MRKFYLHTYNKSHSFDLNTVKVLATEPSGLGNTFQTSYKESDKGNHLTNIKPKFDPISLKIYFNADGSNGYANYKSFISFLSFCGMSKFIFEYDDGIKDKYCDVVLKSIPKTEINDDGVFVETLSLERQTYWYEVINEEFVFSQLNETPVFSLSFPFSFQGTSFNNERVVENSFFEPAPVSIKISGSITADLNIYIKDFMGETVSEISISKDLPTGSVILIDPTGKKIEIEDGQGVKTNGYDITDKTKQSFLYLPQGVYTLGANIINGANGKIELSIKRYLLD